MDLARGCSPAFTGTVALTNGCRTICVYGDPYSGDVDGEEGPTVFTGQHATGFDGLAVPSVESKYTVGFRDRIPAFDVMEYATVGLACTDTAVIEIAKNIIWNDKVKARN